MSGLSGQTVVLVGGSAGIGLETARLARAEGADVVLTGRDPGKLSQAAEAVGARSTAAFDASRRGRGGELLRGPARHGRPRPDHRGRPALRAAAGDDRRRRAHGARRPHLGRARGRPPRRPERCARVARCC
ncbi:SDR family NAD(P)-dependent oxidoreductase [Amycolatopsis sp. RTGN1]|uniref:SDR family NAD(P)-dependent oxidoreductase n=1 Tax=Amycolatopsis ponsaeliensis TaxID=2992142 RepID=UPI00254AED12|nr:SDR family NAD(P)-dependent oxidoreductase [Amycolatopsis sp. RTGN1]